MFYAIDMSLPYKTLKGISVMLVYRHTIYGIYSGLILDLSPANERQRYFITTFDTARAQNWNQPYILL